MSRTQYPIHPDFRKWAHIDPPIWKPMLPATQWLLRLLFAMEKSGGGLTVSRRSIPTPGGKAVRALLYEPRGVGADAPCLIVFHGGGYVFPAAPYHYRLTREYALRAGCKALFVDYRLAPKHPFPAALDDCFAAYGWALERAGELGIDPRRVAVTGDSAGGELAATVALMARERGLEPPCGQMLVYPVIPCEGETESMRQFTDTPLCNSKAIAKFHRLYKPDPSVDERAYPSPMRDTEPQRTPATYVETAEFDCLRDGGALYAERLRQAGVPVELNQTKGTIHGFDIVLDSAIVRACVDRRVGFLKGCYER